MFDYSFERVVLIIVSSHMYKKDCAIAYCYLKARVYNQDYKN